MRRDFSAAGPDRLWVADITYVPTRAGWLHLAVVLDAWSGRVVGWAMATHMRTKLVEAGLAMAITPRRPEGRVVHHCPISWIMTLSILMVSATVVTVLHGPRGTEPGQAR